MSFALLVSVLVTTVPSVPAANSAPALPSSTEARGASLIDSADAPPRFEGLLLAQADTRPPSNDPKVLREYYRMKAAEREERAERGEEVDAGGEEQEHLSLSNQDYARKAELQVKLKDLKRERSQMVSGIWATGLIGGGVVTFLFTSIVLGVASIVVGGLIGIYYLATASALDSQIAATESDLRNFVAETAPPRAPMVAVHRLTVARF